MGRPDESSVSHRLDLTVKSESRSLVIGSFLVNIDQVRVADLKSMRKLLPKQEYKLLKNRKCARLSRATRKKREVALMEMNSRLKRENARLRE